MTGSEIASYAIPAAFVFLCLIGWLCSRHEEQRDYGNPGQPRFYIYRRGQWVNPQCSCKNCAHNGHMEYWWEIKAWWYSGTGTHRKQRRAYMSADQRFKTWTKAMKYAEEQSHDLNGTFWRGYY